jgi:type II secretory pathway pseudopilin PulG
MKLKPTRPLAAGVKHRCECNGFTLAEVLAALVFMAIVIPAAVHGLQIANRAGQVALRKTAASRVADRLLNEMIITSQAKLANQSGSIQEGPYLYRWQMRNEPWQLDAIHTITMQVTFNVQGQDYDVRLSTLLDTTQP